jgi:hypothetical protein
MTVLRLIRAVLREIFDETAYERFCAREGILSGRTSYGRFLKNSDSAAKVKCC